MKSERLHSGVSIIIPVYNSEKYIEECLRSACTQSLKEKEILCIDDGSTDQSIVIVENYQKEFPFVRCIKQMHAGAWEARNKGIALATKKYIAFLDADDLYESNTALEKMVAIGEMTNKCICGCGSWYLLENGKRREQKVIDCVDFIPDEGKEISFDEWQNDYGYTNFIFERDFLIRNNILFPQYRRYEDPVFFLKALCTAETFAAVPYILYTCRVGYKDSSELDQSINDILRGIRDNLKIAAVNGYLVLRERLIKRLNEEFYSSIKRQLSDELLRILLDISMSNVLFYKGLSIRILNDLYMGNNQNSEKYYESERLAIRDRCIFDNVENCLMEYGGFAKYLKAGKMDSVCIYGIGLYGRLVGLELEKHGIEIT